jgi:4-carboxymuconolactone decarboxylase
MSERLPVLAPGELSESQRALYDEILGGPRARGPKVLEMTNRAGGLHGPFNAMLLSPKVGTALQALGAAIRYETALSATSREMAILSVAGARKSGYEVYAHEAIARSIGLSEDDLDALRQGENPRLVDADDAAVLDVVRALLLRDDLDDAEYAAALAELGAEGLFELVALVGYYSGLALQLRVFRVQLPSDSTNDGAFHK